MRNESSIHLLVVALAGDILTASVKLVAGLMSRSTAMLSEGIHSIVDVLNQFLLLIGLKQGSDQVDQSHPFGAGKKRFYWSFVVSLLVFGAASVLPISYGFNQILTPQPLGDYNLAYLVLISSFSFQIVSMIISTGVFFRGIKGIRGFLRRLEMHRDIAASVVWLEDTLAIMGLIIATSGIVASQITGDPVFDGIASVLIGILLLVMGYLLASDARHILVDQTISPQVYEKIVQCIEGFGQVSEIIKLDATFWHGRKIFIHLGLDLGDLSDFRQKRELQSQISDAIKSQLLLPVKVLFD